MVTKLYLTKPQKLNSQTLINICKHKHMQKQNTASYKQNLLQIQTKPKSQYMQMNIKYLFTKLKT